MRYRISRQYALNTMGQPRLVYAIEQKAFMGNWEIVYENLDGGPIFETRAEAKQSLAAYKQGIRDRARQRTKERLRSWTKR